MRAHDPAGPVGAVRVGAQHVVKGARDGAAARERRDVCVGQAAVVGDVEPAQRDRYARAQHDARGVRVCEGVELGRRGDVAANCRRAAHDHHAPDAPRRLGMRQQKRRHVGERPYGDDGKRPPLRTGAQGVEQQGHGACLGGRAGRLGHRPGAQAARAVDVGGGDGLAHYGAAGARGHGGVDAEQLREGEGVSRGDLDGKVAGDGGDAHELQPLGVRGGKRQRAGVVDARIAVNDDGRARVCGLCHGVPSFVCGRAPGCVPGRAGRRRLGASVGLRKYRQASCARSCENGGTLRHGGD